MRGDHQDLSDVPRLAFSIREAAFMLAVSPSTVRQWAHEGKLRVLWKGSGGKRRHFSVPRKSIETLLENSQREKWSKE
jgi:excisionase family DNA binding protein